MASVSNPNQTGLIKLWEPEYQPDILGRADSFGDITWTSDEIYENLYEPLRRQYPQWCSRVKIGMDTSGKYEMYAYSFTPEQWKKTVYIQSGVHAIETEGYFGLARMMHLIANSGSPRMKWLRENVRFLVVPMVSVFRCFSLNMRSSPYLSWRSFDIFARASMISPFIFKITSEGFLCLG